MVLTSKTFAMYENLIKNEVCVMKPVLKYIETEEERERNNNIWKNTHKQSLSFNFLLRYF